MKNTITLREASEGFYNNGIELTTDSEKDKFYIKRTYLKDGKVATGKGGILLSEEECQVLYQVLGKIITVGASTQKAKKTKGGKK